MIRCAFCRRRAAGVFAATVLEGPREDEDSWRRGLAPMCKQCQRMLGEAGLKGRQLKGSEQRWWLMKVRRSPTSEYTITRAAARAIRPGDLVLLWQAVCNH